jgi:hypothetical protein
VGTHLGVVGGGQRRVVVVGRVVEHVGGRRVGGGVRLAVDGLEVAGWRVRAAAGGRLRQLQRPGRSVGQGPGLVHGQRTAARGGHARGAQGRGRLSMGHRSSQQRHRRRRHAQAKSFLHFFFYCGGATEHQTKVSLKKFTRVTVSVIGSAELGQSIYQCC